MTIPNNVQLIDVLTTIENKALPIFFQEQSGEKCSPTHVDDSLEGLVEINIDTDNQPLSVERLIGILKADMSLRGENPITAWNSDGERLDIQGVEPSVEFTLVHVRSC